MSIGEWSREGREVGWAGSDGIEKKGGLRPERKKKGSDRRGGAWSAAGEWRADARLEIRFLNVYTVLFKFWI
jgi:hypothetical protein